MRLTQRAPEKLVFTGQTPTKAPLWVGVALLVGPASLALFAPGPLTLPRVAAAVVLGSIAFTFIALCRPRTLRLVIDVEGRTVTGESGSKRWTADATLRLVAVEPRTPGGRPVYGVALSPSKSGERVLLIATTDPADALRDLTDVCAVLPLPVHAGWGLPVSAPWVDAPPVSSPSPVLTPPSEERQGRRRGSRVLLVGAVAISLGVARTVRDRLQRGEMPSGLSVVLPTLGVIIVAILGAVIGTSVTTLGLTKEADAGEALVSERRLFGLVLGRDTVPRAAIRAAYLVSPDGREPRHLLLETPEGPRAFRYEGQDTTHFDAILS